MIYTEEDLKKLILPLLQSMPYEIKINGGDATLRSVRVKPVDEDKVADTIVDLFRQNQEANARTSKAYWAKHADDVYIVNGTDPIKRVELATLMTGQEWYDRLEKEVDKLSDLKIISTRVTLMMEQGLNPAEACIKYAITAMNEAAKKAAGIA